jgi:hypothetical protein
MGEERKIKKQFIHLLPAAIFVGGVAATCLLIYRNYVLLMVDADLLTDSTFVLGILAVSLLLAIVPMEFRPQFFREYGFVLQGTMYFIALLQADRCTLLLITAAALLQLREKQKIAVKGFFVLAVEQLEQDSGIVRGFFRSTKVDWLLLVLALYYVLPDKAKAWLHGKIMNRIYCVLAMIFMLLFVGAEFLTVWIDWQKTPVSLVGKLPFSYSGYSLLQLMRDRGLRTKLVCVLVTLLVLIALYMCLKHFDLQRRKELWCFVGLFLVSLVCGGMLVSLLIIVCLCLAVCLLVCCRMRQKDDLLIDSGKTVWWKRYPAVFLLVGALLLLLASAVIEGSIKQVASRYATPAVVFDGESLVSGGYDITGFERVASATIVATEWESHYIVVPFETIGLDPADVSNIDLVITYASNEGENVNYYVADSYACQQKKLQIGDNYVSFDTFQEYDWAFRIDLTETEGSIIIIKELRVNDPAHRATEQKEILVWAWKIMLAVSVVMVVLEVSTPISSKSTGADI